MNNKKTMIIVLFLIFIYICIANNSLKNNSVKIKNIFIPINNYIECNYMIEETNKTFNRDKYNELVNKISSYKDSKIKDNLNNRLNNLNKLISDYERKLEIAKNNPDKSSGVVMNQDNVKVLETLTGNITAYTPYCGGGCNGKTASGVFVGNNIFYNDKEYGLVRIVAGDASYPFGTIVRIKGLYYFNEDVYAIVLDRGGIVGKNKWALFDLLFYSDGNSNDFGVQKNIKCEILRLGY